MEEYEEDFSNLTGEKIAFLFAKKTRRNSTERFETFLLLKDFFYRAEVLNLLLSVYLCVTVLINFTYDENGATP